MGIDKLNPTAAIIAALRAEATPRKDRAGKDGGASTKASPSSSGGPPDVAVLKRKLAEVANAVDVTDAAAVNAVKPRVVREILLWQFGAELREHPDWQPMLESIVNTLDASPQRQGDFASLLASLKSQS